jgi:septum formation protein
MIVFPASKEHGAALKQYSDNHSPLNIIIPLMIKINTPIFLASKSPRRRDMMQMMGLEFLVKSSDIPEILDEKYSPSHNVKRISLEKCLNVASEIANGIVIAADTIVVLEGKIIGKPNSKMDAKRILTDLSGKMHLVYTGYSLLNKKSGKIITDYSKTKVYFRDIRNSEIKNYVDSGSPMDKAGAYGIQDDYGAVFVEKIIGCYYNVLGFPASKIYQALINIL